jgi:uncharacterized protein YodC (DUF2158 family)
MSEKLNFSVGDAVVLKTGSVPCVIQEISENNMAKVIYWSVQNRFFEQTELNLAGCVKMSEKSLKAYNRRIISRDME